MMGAAATPPKKQEQHQPEPKDTAPGPLKIALEQGKLIQLPDSTHDVTGKEMIENCSSIKRTDGKKNDVGLAKVKTSDPASKNVNDSASKNVIDSASKNVNDCASDETVKDPKKGERPESEVENLTPEKAERRPAPEKLEDLIRVKVQNLVKVDKPIPVIEIDCSPEKSAREAGQTVPGELPVTAPVIMLGDEEPKKAEKIHVPQDLKARPFSLILTRRKLPQDLQEELREYYARKVQRAKMKITPTRAELRASGRSCNYQEELAVPPRFQAPPLLTSKRRRTASPVKRLPVAVLVSDSSDSEGSYAASDEEATSSKKTVETVEKEPSTSSLLGDLQTLAAAHNQPVHPRIIETRSAPHPPVDLTERPATQVNRPHSYEGGPASVIFGEHNYCTPLAFSRPNNPEWRETPKREARKGKKLQQPYKRFTDGFQRPSYVMSKPWLFAPVLDDSEKEVSGFQAALGFEEVFRGMLKMGPRPTRIGGGMCVCKECKIEFSSEWFTFKSHLLCGACYDKEVHTRNGIIYWTEVSRQARDFKKTPSP